MKENDIQLAVCDYLSYKGYFFWRQNTFPTFDPIRKQFRSMPKYAMKGVSDIILLHEGMAYFLEIKRPNAKQNDNQKEFQRFVENAGCKYHIITSLDNLAEIGF